MGGDNFSIVLKTDSIMGRYFAAARRIKPGELILQDDPIIVCPNAPTDSSTKTCVGCCGVTQTSMPCVKCGWPVCKEECGDIPDHANFECKIFTEEQIKLPLPSPYCFIAEAEYIKVLRCLLLRELGKEDEAHLQRWNKLKDFEAHVDLRKANPKILFMSKLIRKFIQEVCKLPQFDDEIIDFVLGAIDVNAFKNVINPILFPNGKVPQSSCIEKNATVLYQRGSLVAHGCRRNTQSLTFPNGQLEMRAGAEIEEDEPITHAYVDLMIGTPERRKLLREQFYFDCTCPRCADSTELGTYLSALKCQQCPDGFLLMDNPLDSFPYWTCNNNCGNIQPTEYEQELLEELRKDELKIIKSDRKNNAMISSWIELLEKYSNKLHENHYCLLDIQVHLIRCMAKVPKPPKELVEDMQKLITKYKNLYFTFYPNIENENCSNNNNQHDHESS